MEQEARWLFEEKYGGAECEAFRADVLRLAAGEPLAYVIGWIPFCHARISLDSHPLIPRPETEFWVMQAIAELKTQNQESLRVLDLCAGSGCIGIAVLKELPNATCDFVEIDETHHKTILKNAKENGIDEDRIKIIGGNLFEQVQGTYDAILTNPPYIDPNLSGRVQESVLHHEPEQALWGGQDGMELITEILQKAPDFLNPNGVLYIEHEPEQETMLHKILPGIVSYKDQYDLMRFSVYRKG